VIGSAEDRQTRSCSLTSDYAPEPAVCGAARRIDA
jgi:hypothetical protein